MILSLNKSSTQWGLKDNPFKFVINFGEINLYLTQNYEDCCERCTCRHKPGWNPIIWKISELSLGESKMDSLMREEMLFAKCTLNNTATNLSFCEVLVGWALQLWTVNGSSDNLLKKLIIEFLTCSMPRYTISSTFTLHLTMGSKCRRSKPLVDTHLTTYL